MSNKVRSARGELVDFALLEMKAQLSRVDPSKEVSARKAKIEARPVYVEDPVEVPDEKTVVETGIINQKVRKKS